MSQSSIPEQYIECGQVINTHGCRGAVKVDPWTDSPDDFKKYPCLFVRVETKDGLKAGFKELTVSKSSVLQGRFALLEFDGLTDMTQADALRGAVLYVDRKYIPLKEGQYLLSDTLGCPVLDARRPGEDAVLGHVTEIMNGSVSPIFVIETPDKKQVLVPAIPQFVKKVEPGRSVLLEPIDGMFENIDTGRED